MALAQKHYVRPAERPFSAEERAKTTILFGNLTPKHEAFIQAVFRGCGYNCEALPTPTRATHETGKEYCNNGLCNPNYFTAGNLIEYLRRLERTGMGRSGIVDRYVYFSAGGCGPCRFGMYESEYREALAHAGFQGFRVLTFQSNRVIKEGSGEPGLKYTLNFGMGMLNALILGDLLFEMAYQIRPYEVHRGETDRTMADCVAELEQFLHDRCAYEVRFPAWIERLFAPKPKIRRVAEILTKIHYHLRGDDLDEALQRTRARLDSVEIDRTRPRPLVKITGEFFSALAEGDANYNMFAFLEREGAEVAVEPISGLVMYWLYQARLHHQRRRGLEYPHRTARWFELRKQLANQWSFRKKDWLLAASDTIWTRQYHRTAARLGDLARHLAPQPLLARLARPYYDPLTRGGEGHLEVAKSLYYSLENRCHMMLSLKPFGCMPSTQSDGVMAVVAGSHPEMLFLPIETSADGEINALSRVQMALGDAHRRARREFDQAVRSTGRTLDEIRAYVQARRELRRPFYPFPRRKGVAGTAAQFVLHVADRMSREAP